MTANAKEVPSLHTATYGEGRRAAAPPAGPPAPERVLGRYRLLQHLGAGGFGTVWRAHDERLDREVAVKRIVLAPGAAPDRVTREALACARLAHPAIVALYEAAADVDAFYLVSELVHGATLAQLIEGDELTDEDIFAVGLSLCDALAHAHERGVIHRDVKPHNVLVPDPPGPHPAAAKLADFGGAWITGEDPLTRTGDVMGTLAYMAPEQAEGAELGVECDLYSCALVCFEALSGINPVRGPTPAATARRIGTELPSLREHRPDLPGELLAAIDVALDPMAEHRGELADLREALAEAATPRPRRRGWRRAREKEDAPAPRRGPPPRRGCDGTDDDSLTGWQESGPTGLTRAQRTPAPDATRSPTARHPFAWPEVAWEGEDPDPLGGAGVGDPRRAVRSPRRPERRSGGPVPTPRAAEPVDRPRPPQHPEAEAPVPAPAPLRPPARLLEGAGAGALVAGALYGLGGASQQAAFAAALLTAVTISILPRLGWLAATTAVCGWLVAAHAAGSALLVAAAALPVAMLLRRPGPAWPAPALAPLLGLAGLAAAFPAGAGQLTSWPRRAAVGALGYWWLVLAEPLLGRHLWLGPPPHTPPRGVWEGSIALAAHDVIAPLLTIGVLLGAVLWGLAAAVLPWIVRGRHAAVDVVAATVWAAALASAAPLVDRGGLAPVSGAPPRGLVLGAVVGGLLAVTARAARGRT